MRSKICAGQDLNVGNAFMHSGDFVPKSHWRKPINREFVHTLNRGFIQVALP